MQKIYVILLILVLMFCVVGCNDGQNYQSNHTNENQTLQNDDVSEVVEEIILTKENINDYLKIDVSFENLSVTKSTAFNPPMDKGTGKIVVNTTALKRGDFEDVKIILNFESDRGWDPESITLTIPFNGNVSETKDILSYSSLLFDNPRYEITIMSVSGKFVKQ